MAATPSLSRSCASRDDAGGRYAGSQISESPGWLLRPQLRPGRSPDFPASQIRTINRATTRWRVVFQRFNLFLHKAALEIVIEEAIHVKNNGRKRAQAKAVELRARIGLTDECGAYRVEISGRNVWQSLAHSQ